MAKQKKEAPEKVDSPKVEAKAEVQETVIAPSISKGTKKVKVTPEELMKLQEEQRLIGYDPLTCEAVIKA